MSDVAGAKAANIARCAASGLPTVDGFVITTEAVRWGVDTDDVRASLRDAWEQIGGPDRRLVVRSSSTVEDAEQSSMAGRFTSVLGVVGWVPFLDAVDTVRRSAGIAAGADGEPSPMAVLVQRQIDVAYGGVAFGVDPLTGVEGHVVVEVVEGTPDALVSGVATADHYVLDRHGRVLEHVAVGPSVEIPRAVRQQLVQLLAQVATVFDGPQDIEWAIDEAGHLWLLQSRPITAVMDAVDPHAPLLGPGPVAETFPDPLTTLERDLWIVALADGISRALRATHTVPDDALAASPVVTTVDGQAVVDLSLVARTEHQARWRRYTPRAILRRLGAAWTIGRLRTALPALASTAVATVDRDLTMVGPLGELDDEALVQLLVRSRAELATMHSYEVLCGMLLEDGPGVVALPVVAMAAVAEGRRSNRVDADIVAAAPVALALVPPTLRHPVVLPSVVALQRPRGAGGLTEVSPRDALRMRARWLQELQVRVAWELGARLARRGAIADERAIEHFRLDELEEVVDGAPLPADFSTRAEVVAGPPLPAAFRLSPSGRVVEAHPGRSHRHRDGMPASGGRGIGVVVHSADEVLAYAGDGPVVLVTEHLSPALAPLLPRLAGLVSQTGSALSHLAILSREIGLPVVVGVQHAATRFPDGTRLLVDGDRGSVEVIEDEAVHT